MDKKKYLVEMRKFAYTFPGSGMELGTFEIWYQDMVDAGVTIEYLWRALERIRRTESKWWPGQNLAAMVIKVIEDIQRSDYEQERDEKKALQPPADPKIARESMEKMGEIMRSHDAKHH